MIQYLIKAATVFMKYSDHVLVRSHVLFNTPDYLTKSLNEGLLLDLQHRTGNIT